MASAERLAERQKRFATNGSTVDQSRAVEAVSEAERTLAEPAVGDFVEKTSKTDSLVTETTVRGGEDVQMEEGELEEGEVVGDSPSVDVPTITATTAMKEIADSVQKRSKWEEEEPEPEQFSKKRSSSKKSSSDVGAAPTPVPEEVKTESSSNGEGLQRAKSKWADDDEEAATPAPALSKRKRSKRSESAASQQVEIIEEESVLRVDVPPTVETGLQRQQGATEPAEPRPVLDFHRCRKADDYEQLNRVAEGTYGVVYRARDKRDGTIVALKKVKFDKGSETEGFPVTALREITIMINLQHPNVLSVREVVMSPKNQVMLVMDFVENDFRALMEFMKVPFRTSEVKCLMIQLLSAIDYMHDHWVMHRDLKTANLLYSNNGTLRVCDYGMARLYSDPAKPLTSYVVTLHYRAPELLLLEKEDLRKPANYGAEVDMWSVGCIMAEFLLKETLLPGKGELDQLNKVFKLLGTPSEDSWPGWTAKFPMAKRINFKKQGSTLRSLLPKMSVVGGPTLSDKGYSLLSGMLAYDPSRRMRAKEALKSDWFREDPIPLVPRDMPTFKPLNENSTRPKRRSSLDEFEDEYKKLMADSRFERETWAQH